MVVAEGEYWRLACKSIRVAHTYCECRRRSRRRSCQLPLVECIERKLESSCPSTVGNVVCGLSRKKVSMAINFRLSLFVRKMNIGPQDCLGLGGWFPPSLYPFCPIPLRVSHSFPQMTKSPAMKAIQLNPLFSSFPGCFPTSYRSLIRKPLLPWSFHQCNN